MALHALLGASSANRWLNCPPSARLDAKYPNNTSTAAEEGTLAHSLGELKLQHELKKISTRMYNIKFKKIKANKLFTEDMPGEVDKYADSCLERVSLARATTPDALFKIEQKLNYSKWVPSGFGTGDFVIIADGTMEIVDLKYGKGIPVSALDNKQMRLYALGAISEFSFLYDIKKVKMTIIQPRLDSISTDEVSASELLTWANEVVTPLAKQAFAGEGEYKAGDHCIWCGAKATCRARADKNMEMAKFDFKPKDTLSEDEIAEILGKSKELAKWSKDVEKYALDQALAGVNFSGYKLVEGKSSRKYINEAKIYEVLGNEGIDDETLYKPKELLGITAMEKAIGKKQFNELCSEYIEKPMGKPTLVPESDKRNVYNSVDGDFGIKDETLLEAKPEIKDTTSQNAELLADLRLYNDASKQEYYDTAFFHSMILKYGEKDIKDMQDFLGIETK